MCERAESSLSRKPRFLKLEMSGHLQSSLFLEQAQRAMASLLWTEKQSSWDTDLFEFDVVNTVS